MNANEPRIEYGGECKPAYVHFEDGVTIEVPAGPSNDAMPRARLISAAQEQHAALEAVEGLLARIMLIPGVQEAGANGVRKAVWNALGKVNL